MTDIYRKTGDRMKAKEFLKKKGTKVKDATQKGCSAVTSVAMKVLRRVLP